MSFDLNAFLQADGEAQHKMLASLPSEEQAQAFAQIERHNAVMRTVGLASAFTPPARLQRIPEDKRAAVAAQVLDSQQMFNQLVENASVESTNREEYPYWLAEIVDSRFPGGAAIHVPKDFDRLTSINDVIGYYFLYATLIAPSVHALAAFNGGRITYKEAKAPPPGSPKKLILSH